VACVDVNARQTRQPVLRHCYYCVCTVPGGYKQLGTRLAGYSVQMYRVLTTVPLGACLPVPVQSFTVLYIMSFERPS